MSKDSKTRNEQLAVAARHAAGIGAGWFTLTLLARQLMDAAGKAESDDYNKTLKSLVNARRPTFSPDLKLNDQAKEDAMANLGSTEETSKDISALLSKRASDDNEKDSGIGRKIMDKFINPVPVGPGPVTPGSVAGAFGNTGIHPLHIALTLAAGIAGTAGGMALSKKLSNKSKERELDERIRVSKQEMDQLIAEEYRRTRGLDKTAKDNDTFLEKGLSGATKLYLLYAAGVAALSYGISKKYLDENDPNRARLSALKDLAKDRARMSGAPQIMVDPTDPTYSKLSQPAQG